MKVLLKSLGCSEYHLGVNFEQQLGNLVARSSVPRRALVLREPLHIADWALDNLAAPATRVPSFASP